MGATQRRYRLVAARKAAGYTQEQLAELLHVERSTVNRWEVGKFAPQPYLWPKLAKLLGLRSEQLQALLANERTEGDMNRRSLVKWGIITAAAAGLNGSDSPAIGMADVHRLRQATTRLHRLDQQHGGDDLWRSAVALARDSEQLLNHGRYNDTVGRHLLSATGASSVCAGWLAFDAGQQNIARTCFTDALMMSRQAGDPYIEVRALANLSLQSNRLNRPREASRFAGGAEQSAASAGSPHLRALPQLRVATTNAITGNARDVDTALASAYRALEQAPDTAEAWSSFLTPSEVDAVAAACAITLGRPSQAATLLDKAIGGYARDCGRNLALYRVRLAQARLDMGEVDGAAETADRALDDLVGRVASWRVTEELDALAAQLRTYATVDGVAGFLARHKALTGEMA